MNKKVKYLAYAIAVVLVTGIMTVAIWAATSATSGISANVSWTASAGIEFELEAWVVNNPAGNGIGNTTTPKSITKQIVTASTSNSTASGLAGELNCGFYDGTNDGVNNPSNIVFTYKIKNTGNEILKVTATKTLNNQAESGTTASNHEPAVVLSSKLGGTNNTETCISSLIGTGYNIASGKTLEYIITLSISNADLSISSFDAGVTFSLGVGESGTPTMYVNGVAQSSPAIDGATTVGDYEEALDGSQYPGYFYDEDLTIYANEDDIVTNDTKLYTKPATLDKLTFISNGDGTCSVKAGNATSINSYQNSQFENKNTFLKAAPGSGGPDEPGSGEIETSSSISGEVIIPTISPLGDVVTSISASGFTESEDATNGITSVVMPNTIVDIGDSAFAGCKYLVNITISKKLMTIGPSAFSCCGLTSFIIPNSVREIGASVFGACSKLASIDIPDSVTSIGNCAFQACTSLTSIYIPSSVTTISTSAIGSSLFNTCSSSLKIYCGASSKPSGWGSYWNYRNTSATYTPTWGVTREQYNSLYA